LSGFGPDNDEICEDSDMVKHQVFYQRKAALGNHQVFFVIVNEAIQQTENTLFI